MTEDDPRIPPISGRKPGRLPGTLGGCFVAVVAWGGVPVAVVYFFATFEPLDF